MKGLSFKCDDIFCSYEIENKDVLIPVILCSKTKYGNCRI